MENRTKEKNRLMWLDMARGFALFVVMFGHCITKGTFLHKFIFTFHVPMFFIISGYLYRLKEGAAKKDAKQLLLPYVICVIIIAISGKIIGPYSYYGNTRSLLLSAALGSGVTIGDIKLIGALWFLPAMFLARRYMDFVFGMVQKEWQRAIIFFAFVLAAVAMAKEKIRVPLNADVALVAAGFMFVGYLIRTYEIHMNSRIAFMCLAFWAMSLCCERINIGNRDYEIWQVTFVGAIGASFLLMELFRKQEQIKALTWLNKFWAFTGKHSLVLLCIHDLDWRMPFTLWGEKFAIEHADFAYPNLILIVRRMTFNYAWLLLWLVCVYVVQYICKNLSVVKKPGN